MRIQLYDRGTPQGKKLFQNLEEAAKRLQVDYDPEYIKDMKRVYDMGVQGNTILVIDGQIALVDNYPSLSELSNLLSDYLK